MNHWRFCGKLHRGKTAIQEARCKPQSPRSLAALTVARLQGKLTNTYQVVTGMVLWESDCFYSLCNTSQNWPNPLDARTPLTHLQPGGWVSLFTASFCNIMMFWQRSGFRGRVGLLKPFPPECCYDTCMVQGEKRASPPHRNRRTGCVMITYYTFLCRFHSKG